MTDAQRRYDELLIAFARREAKHEELLRQVIVNTAQATVQGMADAGLLRLTPATTAIVKRVVRDEAGRITAIVERLEQLEPAEPQA